MRSSSAIMRCARSIGAATRATTCSGSSASMRTGTLLDEKPVVRNDAIMMYSPYLEEGGASG